ncbi:MAG: AAA family ATPase, partial [Halobacteria archaeon]
RDYAIQVVTDTRNDDIIEYGASPRATLSLILAAKSRAFLRGRNHVSEEDINEMAVPVLRHRIIIDFEAEREGMTPDDAVQELL